VVPDVITTAKSLGGGMPISAVIGRSDIMEAAHPGGLGGTYSGNPLSCVAALAALDLITAPGFLERAQAVGERLRAALEAIQGRHPALIGDVRGLGPMLAMELVRDPVSKAPFMEATQAVTAAALQRGVIALRAGLFSNCVRLLPPLNVSDALIDEAMTALSAAVDDAVAGLGSPRP
jgi:4-aminobutyrate aminotransferase/(S)-3-amino-2-methylpropionate transaminase